MSTVEPPYTFLIRRTITWHLTDGLQISVCVSSFLTAHQQISNDKLKSELDSLADKKTSYWHSAHDSWLVEHMVCGFTTLTQISSYKWKL